MKKAYTLRFIIMAFQNNEDKQKILKSTRKKSKSLQGTGIEKGIRLLSSSAGGQSTRSNVLRLLREN